LSEQSSDPRSDEDVAVEGASPTEVTAEQTVAEADLEAAERHDATDDDATDDDATADDATAVDAADDEVDPVEEFKAQLKRLPGDWFVVHSYAGYENRVKANLENRISSLNMEDYIFGVEVPMEEVQEIKNGVRKQVRRVRIPGYVLVRMDLTDESWGAVRHTPV
jgi:transcriptional antiterminator NusG